MRFSRFAIAALLALGLAACEKEAPAPAAPAPVAKPAAPAPAPAVEDVAKEVAQVQKLLAEKFPTLKLNGISRMKFANSTLFEFSAGNVIGYTNQNVDWVMLGEVVTISDGKVLNMTKARAVQAGAKVYETVLGMAGKHGLSYTYGNGEREFVVFSDPDCPFCQDFEAELDAAASVVNARVVVLPYVLTNLHPNGTMRAKHIWCTADPAKAWKDWMRTARAAGENQDIEKTWATWSAANPATANCEAAKLVDTMSEAGRSMGFNQTPTLMFKNGMTWPGAPTMDELQEALQQVSTDLTQATPQPIAAPASATPAVPGSAPANPEAATSSAPAPVVGQ